MALCSWHLGAAATIGAMCLSICVGMGSYGFLSVFLGL